MRKMLLATVACVLISGCDTGPSETELTIASIKDDIDQAEGNLKDREGDLDDVKDELSDANNQCSTANSDNSKRIAELRSTITDNLQEVSRGGRQSNFATGSGWTIAIEDLSENRWSWREEEAEIAANNRGDVGAREDRIRYSVDPGSLSTEVEVDTYRGYPAVLLKCSGGSNCITATGQRMEATGNTRAGTRDRRQSDIDEKRPRNFWPVATPGTSGKVAQALSDLLELYRTGEPEACGKVGDLEDRKSSLETEISGIEKEVTELKSDLRREEAKLD